MRQIVSVCCLLGFMASSARAVDLKSIDRSIAKLPELRSASPEYCLLVLGPEAAKHVWLIHDGDALYVDRNGNGDLTEPGERVTADPEYTNVEDGVFNFIAGDIPDGSTSHKDLHVAWYKVDHLLEHESYRPILEKIVAPRCCRISLDVAIPGQRGTGIEGRITQLASAMDEHGWLRFGRNPEAAPIIHFGGPWELALTEKVRWRVGRSKELDLAFGTPGLGPGTMACVAYEGVIPPTMKPKVRALFPNSQSGGEPIATEFELPRRCCTFNLYGDVSVPEYIGAGKAKIEISLESWPGGYVAPAVREIDVLPALPGPKYEPVSPRLVSKLEHSQRKDTIANLQYFPDGKRLIASNYPGGVIHVWDVASGERQLTIEAGEGLRPSMTHFHILPDWQTALVPRQIKGTFTKVERGEKTLNHVEYSDLVYVYDLNTGKRLRTLQDAPPRGIVTLSVFPDGSQFFTQEEVPGDFDGSRPRALSLWNVATGEHRQVNSGSAHAMCYAPDGRRVAIALPRPGDDQMYFNGSVKILALPDLREVCTIPIDRERAYAWVSCFALDGAVAIGTLTWYVNPDNYQKHDSALKMWDTATGQEVFSLPQPGKEDYFTGVVASPDGRSMVVTSVDRKANRGRVHLVDVAQRTSQVLLETDGLPGRLVFHPSEVWCAMAVQSYPKSLNPRDPSVDDLPQPSILCLDAKTGEILEKVLTPPAFLSSMAFSPDGQTLATSGNGEVLLWDFRVPPGKLSNVAAK